MYFLLENFSAGVDTRKNAFTAPPGTLRTLINGHITPGGEIEKRHAFVSAFDVTGTFGMAALGADLYVFGNAASDPTGLDGTSYGPVTLRYMQLPAGGPTLTKMLDADIYDDKIYVVAEDAGGTAYHFFDGVLVPGAAGRNVRTFQQKIYSLDGNTIRFSAALDPTDWAGVGSGFINTSVLAGEAQVLRGAEIYYDQLAVFSKSSIQIWNMDIDPTNNKLSQVIRSFGLAGQGTPKQYGPGDILFLSRSGVRSLLARDSSNSGSVSDVGSPIDEEIHTLFETETDAFFDNAGSLLDPLTGRFWLAFEDNIWVLSYFPGPSVSAWSQYRPETEDTAFKVDRIDHADGTVCIRGQDDQIYVYGGQTGTLYDTSELVVELPYMSFDRPAHRKNFHGIDAAVSGDWLIEASLDAESLIYKPIASLKGNTTPNPRITMAGTAPGVALRLSTTSPARARVSNVIVHYELADAD